MDKDLEWIQKQLAVFAKDTEPSSPGLAKPKQMRSIKAGLLSKVVEKVKRPLFAANK